MTTTSAGGLGADGAGGPAIIHLVPHTHWDREWYEPFQVFRMRLVELVDQLLDAMDADDRLAFTLDGQVATIDDYLEIRPENRYRIERLIAQGRLAIGPWQILMDEFLVSGETLIRNLEIGWHAAEAFGAAMPVGYLPDMFGHVAQMPQILRRAGIRHAVVWRGVPAAIDRHAFTWRSPDGSSVRAEYLVGGYGNAAYLLAIPDRLADKVARYVDASRAFYGDRSILAMYGTDHAVPSPRLAQIVEDANAQRDDIAVRIETLTKYIRSFDAASADPATPDPAPAPVWTGELRSAARANMLMNVTSARIDIKAAAGRAERILERYAEPLAALHGGSWPTRLLDLAWRRLVDNSAHDSICGCSHDAVVSQVLTRFAEAEQIGRGVVAAAIRPLAGAAPRGSVVVVNPSPHDRLDVVEVDLDVPAAWDEVELELANGQRLATQLVDRPEIILRRLRLTGRQVPELFARRLHGRELFGHSLDGHLIQRDGDERHLILLMDDPSAEPDFDVDSVIDAAAAAAADRPDEEWQVTVVRGERRRLVATIPAPPLGAIVVRPVEAETPAAGLGSGAVVVGDRSIDNGLVGVVVADDGTFDVRRDGVLLAGVGRLVDGGDFGDTYNSGRRRPTCWWTDPSRSSCPSANAVRFVVPSISRPATTGLWDSCPAVSPVARRPGPLSSPRASSSGQASRSSGSASCSPTRPVITASAGTCPSRRRRTTRPPKANSRSSIAASSRKPATARCPLRRFPPMGSSTLRASRSFLITSPSTSSSTAASWP